MLGLDLGEARIGVAVSDPSGTICTPLAAIKRTESDDVLRYVATLASTEQVSRIIVGLPITMEGHRGTKAAEAARFRSALKLLTDLPVDLWDERLTTVEAHARLRDANAKKRLDKGRIDSIAAALVLESYLAAH